MSPQHSRRLIIAALLVAVMFAGCAPALNSSLRGLAADLGLTCPPTSFCALSKQGYYW